MMIDEIGIHPDKIVRVSLRKEGFERDWYINLQQVEALYLYLYKRNFLAAVANGSST